MTNCKIYPKIYNKQEMKLFELFRAIELSCVVFFNVRGSPLLKSTINMIPWFHFLSGRGMTKKKKKNRTRRVPIRPKLIESNSFFRCWNRVWILFFFSFFKTNSEHISSTLNQDWDGKKSNPTYSIVIPNQAKGVMM